MSYAQLNIVKRNLSELQPHPQNPRQHPDSQKRALVASIEQFSYAKGSICIQKDTDFIIAGHAIRDALMEKGFTEADCVELNFDNDDALAFLTADNQYALLAEWDEDQLQANLDRLKELNFEMPDLGFEMPDMDMIDKEETFDVAEAMEEEAEPITQTGDIWLCGKHRVMCGDSTKEEDVERLMDGQKVDLVLTDPPYGINIINGAKSFGSIGGANVVKANKYQPIIGDDKILNPSFLLDYADYVIIWGGNYFANNLPNTRCWIVWDKKGREWNDNFSDCEIAWTNYDKPSKIFRHIWMGMVQSGKREERVHPTQKPSNLFVDILNYLDETALHILDLFLGSGTTLIACEKTGRICYGMEIACSYVDVCLKRYFNFTNQIPVRESDGFEFPVD